MQNMQSNRYAVCNGSKFSRKSCSKLWQLFARTISGPKTSSLQKLPQFEAPFPAELEQADPNMQNMQSNRYAVCNGSKFSRKSCSKLWQLFARTISGPKTSSLQKLPQ